MWRTSASKSCIYCGADKFLARQGTKQAKVSVRMAWISFRRLALQRGKKLDDSSRLDVVEITCFLACFLPGRAKDLSAPRYLPSTHDVPVFGLQTVDILEFITQNTTFTSEMVSQGRSQRPLACWDCGFESSRELGMSVTPEVCVLPSRGPCDGTITRPEELNVTLKTPQ